MRKKLDKLISDLKQEVYNVEKELEEMQTREKTPPVVLAVIQSKKEQTRYFIRRLEKLR